MAGSRYESLSTALTMTTFATSTEAWTSYRCQKTLFGFQLPEPTYEPPNRTKKSHARKRPSGHIPRPRNAFILFRCDFVRQKKIPESVENDHRNISRIVGKIWQQMTPLDREPWTRMAEMEKMDHFRKHPGFSFSSGGNSTRNKIRRGDDITYEIQKEDPGFDEAFRHALRCPSNSPSTNTLRVPPVNSESSNGYGAPPKVRDDPPRRSSRVTLSESIHRTASANALFYAYDLTEQNYRNVICKDEADETVHVETPDNEEQFLGSCLTAARYPIPDHTENSFSGWFDPALLPRSMKVAKSETQEDSAPLISAEFCDPFLSSIPPLPQAGMPFSFEEHPNVQSLSNIIYPQNYYSEEDAKTIVGLGGLQIPSSLGDLQRASDTPTADYLSRQSDIMTQESFRPLAYSYQH